MSFEREAVRLARIKPNLERRALILQLTRSFFVDQGFLEIETPIRVPAVAPEKFIKPFTSEPWFLSTSPELHMKRLLASGYDRLFQISRCFRAGESGRLHNPEFTMLEWYRQGANYLDMMDDTQKLVTTLAKHLGPGTNIHYLGRAIDLFLPWPSISVTDAFTKAAGWDPVETLDEERFDVDLVTKVIPSLRIDRPIIVKDYPASMAALSRLAPGNPKVAERAELFVAGLELANAYTELNDAEEQRRRFEQECEAILEAGGNVGYPQRFMDSMPHMPECGGIALGMDRLLMLFCNVESIEDVLAFPQEWA